MGWTVVTDLIDDWIDALDDATLKGVVSALLALEFDGPSLGRPLVDHVKGSALHNLKELRPPSSGRSEVRILFVFDTARRAIMLLAGDKAGFLAAGPRWNRWYRKAVPEAERRYLQYLRTQKERDDEQNT